jgi:hypothetical protein
LTKFAHFSIQMISLLFLAVLASMNWATVDVSGALSGKPIGVSGFAAFPPIGSLLTLQLVILGLSIFLSGWAIRLLTASLVPLMTWLLFLIGSTASEAVSREVSRLVLESTGVAGALAQQEFVQVGQLNLSWVLFAVALGCNILVLVASALIPRVAISRKSVSRKMAEPEDLWGSQR